MRNRYAMFITLLACAALLPSGQAISPAPDGGYPNGNTAEGQNALLSLTTGSYNTAAGFLALKSDIAGQFNTAIGAGALVANVGDATQFRGINNTATGAGALLTNSTGSDNTASGAFALFNNTIGTQSVANGTVALFRNTSGTSNTGIGYAALYENTTGNFNVALGNSAGLNGSGSNNVYIGTGMVGVAGESNACYIASIFGQISAGGIPVLVNSDNKLGTVTSSRRFKEDINPMDDASEAVLALKPVTFRYKKNIDPTGTLQFGLVAEDVEKVNQNLVLRDKKGKPYSVRYDQVNAMLLNEFLKEHKKVQQLEASLAAQRKDFGAAIAELKKETDLEIQKATAQIRLNEIPARMAVKE